MAKAKKRKRGPVPVVAADRKTGMIILYVHRDLVGSLNVVARAHGRDRSQPITKALIEHVNAALGRHVLDAIGRKII
jgi:hypothetical protein